VANRRDLIKTAIGISALPLTHGAFASVTSAGSSLRDALVDERNEASCAFGRAADARGIAVHRSRGDWSQLWLDYLDCEWRARPKAIAGITRHGALFTLEQLARSRGMRPVFVAERRRYRNGAVSLRLSGVAKAATRAHQSVGLDDAAWGASMAEILVDLSATAGDLLPGLVEITNGIEAPVSTEHPDQIYAWMIVPVARAPRFV
jgi:hypothetical protein